MPLDQLSTLQFLGNSLKDYAIALIWFVVVLALLKIFQLIILQRLRHLAKKTKTDLDDMLTQVLTRITPAFYLLAALFFSLRALAVPSLVNQGMKIVFTVILVYEVIRGLEYMVGYATHRYLQRSGVDEADRRQNESIAGTLQMVVRILLWAVGGLMILANLGINVTSIIAGLGIGGLAVALAAQSMLEDLFSAISIYFDKPFKIGDYIVIGEHSGEVQRIGMKTTRIKTLQGEELIIPNKELTSSRVQNFKRMEKRRVVFDIGVVYGTSPEKLRAIPIIIKEIIDRTDKVEFNRCYLKEFGDSALIFEIVYYANTSDFAEHAKLLEGLNLKIYQRFNEEKLDFAYPTQTLFVHRE